MPELSRDAYSHYAHYVELLEEVASLVDLVVIVEKGTAGELSSAPVITQRRTSPPARAAELALTLAQLRLQGYRAAFGSYSAYFGIVGGIVGRALGIRTAYWHCRADFFDRAINRRLTLRRIALDTVPFLLSVYLSRRLVTGTKGLAERYAQTFHLSRRKVLVVPNEINVSRFALQQASKTPAARPTILFVGRLSLHKGSDLLAPIFKAVSARLEDVRLLVAGGGPNEASVREKLSTEADDGRVEFFGYVPNTAVPALMHQADILLMPSLEEGFPRRLLEAMAAGLPFVTSNVGGVPEIVGPEARKRLVRPGHVEGYAQEALVLLRNPDLCETLANEGRRHVRQFDVKRVARQFVDQLCFSS